MPAWVQNRFGMSEQQPFPERSWYWHHVAETKAGLLNVSYAIGKRNDVPFNLRKHQTAFRIYQLQF